MNNNASILINKLFEEYTTAIYDLQECKANHLDKQDALTRVETLNTIISGALGVEINVCLRRNSNKSYIDIWKFDEHGKCTWEQRFPVQLGTDFIINALKLKVLYA